MTKGIETKFEGNCDCPVRIGFIDESKIFPRGSAVPKIGDVYYLDNDMGYLGDEMTGGKGIIAGIETVIVNGRISGYYVSLEEAPLVQFVYGIDGYLGEKKQDELREKFGQIRVIPKFKNGFNRFLYEMKQNAEWGNDAEEESF
jgi:hypothetical protein